MKYLFKSEQHMKVQWNLISRLTVIVRWLYWQNWFPIPYFVRK